MQHKMKISFCGWENITHIVLYGYGTVGKACLGKMKSDFKIDFIIDRNAENIGNSIGSIPIYTPESGLGLVGDRKIIVMTGGRAYLEIAEYLKNAGLKEYENFSGIEPFITWWYWGIREQNCVMELHTALTMRCTLKCKDCNMFVPFYEKNIEYSVEQLKKEIGILFSYIDYLFCYTLLGGEPFLYKGIGEIIEYIAEVYGNKVGTIKVITNGTVIPSPETIRILQKHNVWVSISDYTAAVPYEKKLSELCGILKTSRIDYSVANQKRWRSFGFPVRHVNIDDAYCAMHMRECSPIFHGYNDGKVFYCHVAWSAEKIGRYHLKDKDFVDLRKLRLASRHIIAEHCLGEIEDGYVSFCQFCGGCGKDNMNEVMAGVQMLEKSNKYIKTDEA